MIAAEEAVNALVGVQAQKLASQLDGDDLAVGQPWLRPASPQRREIQGFDLGVDEVEHVQQVIRYRHGGLLGQVSWFDTFI